LSALVRDLGAIIRVCPRCVRHFFCPPISADLIPRYVLDASGMVSVVTADSELEGAKMSFFSPVGGMKKSPDNSADGLRFWKKSVN
jgi:hypothetical protein